MTQDEMKKAAGWAALKYVVPGTIVGVGTGSTVNHFIDALATMKDEIKGAVSSSIASTERLKGFGIPVFDLNDIDALSVYVDGADEINGTRDMIKGGRRRPDPREDSRGRGRPVHLHHRQHQDSRGAGPVPAAGGGDPHGP